MSGVGPIPGMIGKLPAHGDFVRRGGPAQVLSALDRWLDTELGAAVADVALDEAVAALDGWRFAFDGAAGLTLAAAIASEDRVGRIFPLIGTITGAGFGFAAAEAWCAAAAAALVQARDAGLDADAALAMLTMLDAPVAEGGAASGQWRAGDAAPAGGARLPAGDAFRALLRGAP